MSLEPTSTAVIVAVAAAGVASSAIDLRTRRVPNGLTAVVAAAGIALAALDWTMVSVPAALGGCALGIALMLPGHLLGGTGAGDVKLLGAIGTLLGPKATLMAFMYTAIAGGVLGLIVATRRRRVRESLTRTATLVRTGGGNAAEIDAQTTNRFAYAPAVAVGALVAALGW
jgi:prepilin peptidase CpaA